MKTGTFLIKSDYLPIIETTTLDQVCFDSNGVPQDLFRIDAEIAETQHMLSYIRQLYYTAYAVRPVYTWNFTDSYNATERFYLTGVTYVAANTYALNVLVTDGTSVYISLVTDNTANPLTDATKWTNIGLLNSLYIATISPYNSAYTYAIGAWAIGSDGNTYKSLLNSNTGNDPTTDIVHWIVIGGPITPYLPTTKYNKGDLAIDLNGFVYKSLQVSLDTSLPVYYEWKPERTGWPWFYPFTENTPTPSFNQAHDLTDTNWWLKVGQISVPAGTLPTDATKFIQMDDRNAELKQLLMDMVLYYLYGRLSNRNIEPMRLDRYDGGKANQTGGALRRLENIRDEINVIDLPKLGKNLGEKLVWGSNRKQTHRY